MIVFRICHPDYAHDLSGYGASLVGARWNERGFPMLYTAETSSLAILEFLVHLTGIQGNLSYKLLTIDSKVENVLPVADLPDHWQNDDNVTMKIGTDWLRSKDSVGLRVPSVHNPLEHNVLWNPRHADFNPHVVRSDFYWYDGRLVQRS